MDKLIIQLGRVYCRVGWTSTLDPLTLPLQHPLSTEHSSLLRQLLPALLLRLSEKTCQSCILLVPINFPKEIVQSVCKILFQNLGVGEIQFLAAECMPLCLTGSKSGLVIHSGFSETVFMPIFQGYPVKIGMRCANIGIRQILLQSVRQVDSLAKPDEKWLVQSSKKMERKQDVTWEGKAIKINYLQRMFGNANAQEENLADIFAQVVSKIPESCLKKILNCLVFSGPLWKWQAAKKTFVQLLVAKIKDQGIKRVRSPADIFIAKRHVREEWMCFAGASLMGARLNARGLRLGSKQQQIVDLVGRLFVGI